MKHHRARYAFGTSGKIIAAVLLLTLAPWFLSHAARAADFSPGDPSTSEKSARGQSHGSLVVERAEAKRIEMIQRVAPSVVSILDAFQQGGGSGVLIDPEGYGLTNYHVIAGLLDERKGWGGLADGVLYELEVLGIDVTGDVAMFRLIPPKSEFRFPYARLGDSDRVEVGDTAIAMGNPFALSEDYTPSISMGIVTGVHRYQWGVRGNLVYSDCIQVDAPINPGNSGGPLFNARGEVIGINGRISVNTRGRFNVGFGYAITVNQIKRFMPALRAGLLAKHGTWQATVTEESRHGGTEVRRHEGEHAGKQETKGGGEESGTRPSTLDLRPSTFDVSGVRFAEVAPQGPAHQAGIRPGDGLLAIDGVPIQSANQVASILGTYPDDWSIVVTRRRGQETDDVVVRLEPVEPRLRKPFEVDQEVNQRAVRRVVGNFRSAVLGSKGVPPLHNIQWRVERQYGPARNGFIRPPERFEASMSMDAGLLLEQGHDDGTAGRMIEVNAIGAVQRIADDEIPSELPPEVSLVQQAQYLALQWLLGPPDTTHLAGAAHRGADAAIPPLHELEFAGDEPPRRFHPSILEIIRVPFSDTAAGRYAFDAQTHLLTRIEIEDKAAGIHTVVHLRDYSADGGAILPHTIEVRVEESVVTTSQQARYCETLTSWRLSAAPVAPHRAETRREEAATGEFPSAATESGFDRAIAGVLPRVVKLYGLRGGRQPGYGTGVLVSSDGLVLTVFSLLIDAENIRAVTADGTRYDAHVVDRDFQRQLALLQLEGVEGRKSKVESRKSNGGQVGAGPLTFDLRRSTLDYAESGLPFFDLANEATLEPGYWVLAAGNSFKVAEGSEPVSLVHGVFSTRTRLDARRRRMDFPYRGDVLVIDAITSNPGAPGSAVVNLDGKFVGMVGREVTSNLTHTHFNYAVPRDVLHAYVEEVTGRSGGPGSLGSSGLGPISFLSGQIESDEAEGAADLGIRMSRFGYKQILPLVERVVPDSPAEKAGLRRGDLILTVNGRSVPDLSAFESRMQGLGPGQAADLVIRRGRTIVSVHIEPAVPTGADDKANPVRRFPPTQRPNEETDPEQENSIGP